jgi:predicted enzyme related to lactoylglutathione lyase
MPVALHHVVIDAHDLPALARFWSAALGWPILSERDREVIVGPDLDAPIGLCFMPSPDDKVVKNRVHLDLNPGGDATPTEREAEIERLVALGASRVDVGQGSEQSWTVLADPEGNEFCVVRPKADLVG